jgi:hypothetical protein
MLLINDLLEIKMHDGSRHFASFPEIVFFDDFYEITEQLDGAEITEFMMDGVLEMWLDFNFSGHKFSVSNQYGEYWFFVENPNCPDAILLEVMSHFSERLS